MAPMAGRINCPKLVVLQTEGLDKQYNHYYGSVYYQLYQTKYTTPHQVQQQRWTIQ